MGARTLSAQQNQPIEPAAKSLTAVVKLDTLNWVDQSRKRLVPVAIYGPEKPALSKTGKLNQVIILNHGYGQNQWGSFKAYSYLANFLASKGYTVVSIQHELATDDLLPTAGKPIETRWPNWERGVQNILFVIKQLKKTRPDLDYKHLSLIGHSNGGDMVMLFATQHPELVACVISLDNRRMPFPRVSKPRIYSLRSSDQPADEGVLPSSDQQQHFGIELVKLKSTIHNEMDANGKDWQHQEINQLVLDFLIKSQD
ncbi:serine aminopeptidase S33 family [Pedobacter cryoconitis]|uniref:Serine aminopeptidase S33 family n=1 Tax=Pedobacter cryoconitis TaxID=188932 RepID=A0A327SRH9_9SPHI|nr:serine aminopeptidase S33 family [Pedobacter cryoconitis]